MKSQSPRIAAFLTALALPLMVLAASARAAEAETDAASGFSWERPANGLNFSARITGRRIPDYLRDLLENARELRPGMEDGPPPPATLAQLRRRAQEDEKRLEEVLKSEAYYGGRVTTSVRQAQGGNFEVVYFVSLGTRTMIERLFFILVTRA